MFQRPQHVLSRLARHRRIAFVEEPTGGGAGDSRCATSEAAPNVLRCQPLLSVEGGSAFGGPQLPALTQLLGDLLTSDGFRGHVAWLYTPMALPLARRLAPAAIVYDCMDELSAFHGAPAGLVTMERQLLAQADVVFTGGPSLYRAKKDLHPRVLCLPSSVDVAHYRRAQEAAEPADQVPLPHPRLGFFGVIDERLDAGLLARIADARPDWQLVLVGPVVKIDPATLPRRPNIHYLGHRSYEELPAYLAGWDVTLLPFALNDATRFISPTKTLEYMAAEKPIVSTPVRDVAEPYGDVVRIAGDAGSFIAACEAALQESNEGRFAAMRRIVDGTSWDATAGIMHEAIEDALRRREARTGESEWRRATSSSSVPGLPV